MTRLIDGWLECEEEVDRMFSHLTSAHCSRDKPTHAERIKANLLEATLIGLWGGSKESNEGTADEADINALHFLYKNVSDSIKYPFQSMDSGMLSEPVYITSLKDINIYLLFCDTHHIIANKMDTEKTDRYFESLEPIIGNLNKMIKDPYNRDGGNIFFQLIKLGDILEELIGMNSDSSFYRYIDSYSKEKTGELFLQNEEFVCLLREKAAKHSLWVKEDGINPEKIAKLYAELEIFFLRKVNSYKGFRFNQADFTSAVFFSYSDPAIQRPIAEAADVPMLYFHSTGKGHHECPWYA